MQTVFDSNGTAHTAVTVFRVDPSATARNIEGTTRVFFRCKFCKRAWSEVRPAMLNTLIQVESLMVQLQYVQVRRVLDRVTVNTLAECCKKTVTGKVLDTGTSTAPYRCDARCSDAKGNECNCECKGINHGTGIDITKAA